MWFGDIVLVFSNAIFYDMWVLSCKLIVKSVQMNSTQASLRITKWVMLSDWYLCTDPKKWEFWIRNRQTCLADL